MLIERIGTVITDFDSKFGVPRQAGLVPGLEGKIVFEKEYRSADALRGLEQFSHIWLIWGFSENEGAEWNATVRPPRLGGNVRLGVFATRSPFRPNHLGLSCVELDRIDYEDPEGPVLYIRGADIMSGTPLYDIKPYVPYADCIPGASEGFATEPDEALEVEIACETELAEDTLETLKAVLAQDPRPRYHEDGRVYGFGFGGKEVKFEVSGSKCRILSIK